MTRGISPQNRALQDRIMAVLADAHPALLTSSEIAERVGGAKTIWEVCRKGKTYTTYDGRLRVIPCRAEEEYDRFPATHHPGPVPQDSWEVPWNAMDMNAPLNRLARDGVVEKIKVQALRGVLWRWTGDSDGDLADLESWWEASQ